MGINLLEIHPRELRFVVEAKKPSTCSIQLRNKSDQHVAFKVKTTSPKKYCVRPNVGVIKPSGTYEFTVTMQALRAIPLELQCKDKFLVQCTVVPSTITEEEVTSEMFTKDSGRQVEEKKMRVILTRPPQTPVLSPANGLPNLDLSSADTSLKDKLQGGESDGLKISKPTEGLRVTSDPETMLSESTHEMTSTKSIDNREIINGEDIKSPPNYVDELKKHSEYLMSKLDILGSKLAEAEGKIAKVTEERSRVMQEKEAVKHEITLLKRRLDGKMVQIGFPLLYVCMVALISLLLGYLMQ